MGEFSKKYLENVIELLTRIRDEQQDALDAGAKMMADAVEQGHCIFAFGCTHSSLPIQDLVYRAGGLMLINPIFGPGIAALDTNPASISSGMEQMTGYAKVILDNSPAKAGDVLILVSVSGRNAVPIELAQLAKARGMGLIAVYSKEYSDAVTSRHVSGKKMHEFADVVLDNKAPKGDAILEDPRMPQKFNPVSGVTSTALLQALVAATLEELLRRGFTPPVFLAGNVDGGAEYNARLVQQFHDRIFFMR